MTTHLVSTPEDYYRLRQDFNMLLEERDLKNYNLLEVADTLFFTCLHFTSVHFSSLTYRTGDNGENQLEDSIPASRKDSLTNVKELSSLFLEFNKLPKKKNVGKITIELNGKQLIIDQPVLGKWIIEAIELKISEYDYPIGVLGEHMGLLSQVIQSKFNQESSDKTTLLENLKVLSTLSDHRYTGELNRIIASYCLDVNKMLNFLMNEDPEHLSNVQLRLYARILKLFKVHDFTKGFPSKSVLANRLRSVINASA
jgi:hypothetical protein